MPKSAAAFKRSITLNLPSGLEVEARKPNVKRLVMNSPKGTVPEFLTNLVISGMEGKKSSPTELMAELPPDKRMEAIEALSQFGVLIIKSMLIWPVISDNPDYEAGEIALDDLDEEDQQFLTAWGMPKDAQAAETFRQGQVSSVAAPSDVPDLQPTT